MIIDQQYGIGRLNATSLEKNKYSINSLQCMASKCELDKRGILLFPKVIHGHTHAEYISSRSRISLLLNQHTQVIDLCGQVTPVSQPVNSEACHGGIGRMFQHHELQDQCSVSSILHHIFSKMEKH